jgi:hypothetical protein
MNGFTISCTAQGKSTERWEVEENADYWEHVLQFYEDAVKLVRPYMHPDAPIVVDTCWDMSRWEADRLRNLTSSGPVWLDYHHYQCFGDGNAIDMDTHMEAEDLLQALQHDTGVSVILGEYSLALSPQSPGYAPTGWQERYWQQQVEHASNYSIGHFFWNYKLEREDYTEWNYRRCVESGIIIPRQSAPASTCEARLRTCSGDSISKVVNVGKVRSRTISADSINLSGYTFSHGGA